MENPWLEKIVRTDRKKYFKFGLFRLTKIFLKKKLTRYHLLERSSKMNEKIYNLVLYTDGSFQGIEQGEKVGYRGSGVHGYFYEEEKRNKTTSNKPNKTTMTTHGYFPDNVSSFRDNYSNQQVKVQPVSPDFYLDGSYSFVNDGSSVYAELEAVYEILRYVLAMVEHKNENYKILDENFKLKSIVLRIDNEFVLTMISKQAKRERIEYKEESRNTELFKLTSKTIENLLNNGVEISAYKVTGHTGEVGNEIADTLAKHGRIQSCNRNIFKSVKIYAASKYWSKDESRHPLLRYKQLFFTNALRAPNDEILYSVMDYATDVEPGKKTHDACFGLVSLRDYQKLVEDAIRSYHERSYRLTRRAVVSTLNLNNLFNRNTTHYFDMFADSIFNMNKRLVTLVNLHDDPIVYTIDPAGLALQALERMQVLNAIKREFQNREKIKPVRTYVNITNQIYKIDTNKKGEEVKSVLIDNGTNFWQVMAKINNRDLKFSFDLGKDTLTRNQFKQIEKTVQGVWLVVDTTTPDVYKYYTLIDLGEEGIGVFCNFYSGKLFLTEKVKGKK